MSLKDALDKYGNVLPISCGEATERGRFCGDKSSDGAQHLCGSCYDSWTRLMDARRTPHGRKVASEVRRAHNRAAFERGKALFASVPIPVPPAS